MHSGKKNEKSSEVPTPTKPAPGQGSGNVGDALRQVYKDAIDEEIPDAMLDLLNKLG